MSGWKDLHNEGVHLAAAGDLVGARAALEAALGASPAEDRAQCLVNLAHVVDLAGDREHAVGLLTEAIAAGEGPVRTSALAARADLLPWLDRWDEAWQDVETALAASADIGPREHVVLRNTRVGLLMMVGRLTEAEEDATATIGLAAEHAPEYLQSLYYNLALLADEAGDGQRAAVFRMLSENPGWQPLGPRWRRFVELNAEGAVLVSSGDRAGARAAFEAAYRETAGASVPSGMSGFSGLSVAAGTPEATELSVPSGTMKTGDPLAGTPAQRSPEATGQVDQADAGLPVDAGFRADQAEALEALVCRAAVAGNLAGVSEPEEALRWSTEAVDGARAVLALVGDVYDSTSVLLNALTTRAGAYHARTRLPEALADLDEAVELVGENQEAEATVRASRARVLVTGGWYAEAATEARTALDLAYTAAPALAANVHLTLSGITSSTGDLPAAVEHLTLARDLCAATGDTDGEVTSVLSLARLAYLAADGDRADALYDEAEALLADNPKSLAVCLHGRAAVAVLRGRPREALELADRSQTLLGPAATPLELVAMHQVRGTAFEAAGEFAAAESCYGEAETVCEASGLWHVALGMAWWRADALVRRAAAVTGDERRAIALRALDLALPAALASEAVRQRFPHGPLRERWVALASAPATRAAFWAIRAVEDQALAAEYVDHVAGAVSLHAGGVPVERGELVMLPEPPVTGTHLPYAASGLATGEDPAFAAATGFELPPRVRLDPAIRTALDDWIDVAEARYGFPVRSERAVASW